MSDGNQEAQPLCMVPYDATVQIRNREQPAMGYRITPYHTLMVWRNLGAGGYYCIRVSKRDPVTGRAPCLRDPVYMCDSRSIYKHVHGGDYYTIPGARKQINEDIKGALAILGQRTNEFEKENT